MGTAKITNLWENKLKHYADFKKKQKRNGPLVSTAEIMLISNH